MYAYDYITTLFHIIWELLLFHAMPNIWERTIIITSVMLLQEITLWALSGICVCVDVDAASI